MEERLLKRHRHQATKKNRGVLYFTKLLTAWIILFPCFMKEMWKWVPVAWYGQRNDRLWWVKLFHAYFVLHKCYGDWPGIKPVPARWEFCDKVPEPWHDFRLWMGRQRLVRFASQTQNLFARHSSTIPPVMQASGRNIVRTKIYSDALFDNCLTLRWLNPLCFSITNIIIIFIYCNWVVTRWQWLCYMCTKHEIVYC